MGIFFGKSRLAVFLLGFGSLAWLCSGCEEKTATGSLFIEAVGTGLYEIYRISGESPFQFTSEQTGEFNKDIPLAPGSYLVLADCSSESIIIYPHQQQRLISHRVEFIPPHEPEKRDGFSVQCSRSEKTRSRQIISGRFELNVIHGKRDMLIGMVPVHINFEELENPTTPKTIKYQLSGVKVEAVEGLDQMFSFFISPQDEMIAATKYQAFGNWDFLLPGKYVLEVNGSRMMVELQPGERRAIQPALLKVTSGDDVDLSLATKITGSPWLVEVNNGHSLNFNETYPILPGKVSINISGSSQTSEYEVTEGQQLTIPVNSILVHNACKDDETNCEGGRTITLSFPEETYPFIESVSDIPILYIDNGTPIHIGVEGSRDVLYEIKGEKRSKDLALGLVKLVPSIQYKQGQVTDLVRVDGVEPHSLGHTLDLDLEEPTILPLITGTYNLSEFVSSSTNEGDRKLHDRKFNISKNHELVIDFPVYLTEKKFQAYKKKLLLEEMKKDLEKTYSNSYRHGGLSGFL